MSPAGERVRRVTIHEQFSFFVLCLTFSNVGLEKKRPMQGLFGHKLCAVQSMGTRELGNRLLRIFVPLPQGVIS